MRFISRCLTHPLLPQRSGVLFLFLALLWLYTLENRFPFHHHPDEPAKVRQVLRKEWNFHHPVLMVWAGERGLKIARETAGMERNAQSAVIVGRTIVAAFMAGAVVLLTLLAMRAFGPLTGMAAGMVAGINPALFHIAHSFKEDPLLVFGWCAAAAGAAWAWRADHLRAWAAFGAACALASSGKYVGFIAFVVGAGVLVCAMRRTVSNRQNGAVWTRACGFFGAFLLCMVLLNFPVFIHWDTFIAGFGREVTLVREGHHGVARTDVPHGLYFKYLWKDTPVWIWPLAALYLARGWFTRFRWTMADTFLVAVLGIYLAGISCSPKIIYRYAFPMQFFIGFAAVLGGLAVLPAILKERGLRFLAVPAAVCMALLFAGWHLTGFASNPMKGLLPLLSAYRDDHYADLVAWINRELPPDAVIFQPEIYHLPDDSVYVFRKIPPGFPQRVVSERRLFDHGSLTPLRDAGITHVIIPKGRHRRYAEKDVKARDEILEKRNRRAASFAALYEEGTLVYQRERGILTSQQIGVEVYDLRRGVPEQEGVQY